MNLKECTLWMPIIIIVAILLSAMIILTALTSIANRDAEIKEMRKNIEYQKKQIPV